MVVKSGIPLPLASFFICFPTGATRGDEQRCFGSDGRGASRSCDGERGVPFVSLKLMFLLLRYFCLPRPYWCVSSVAVVVGASIFESLFFVFRRCCCFDVFGVLCVIVCARGRADICMLNLFLPAMFVHRSLV